MESSKILNEELNFLNDFQKVEVEKENLEISDVLGFVGCCTVEVK